MSAGDFDEYHAACYDTGRRDGECADLDDPELLALLPRLDGSRDLTLEECSRAVRAWVAGFDFEDYASQYDREECLPEIAFQEWCVGFIVGATALLYDRATH